MSQNNKVIWTEGMFLRPQHFQQQDRNFQSWIETRCGALQSYGWGLTLFELDQQILTLGKIALTSFQGVFPDGTPFSTLDQDFMLAPLEIPPDTKNEIIYLSLPVRRTAGKELAWENNVDELSRYRLKEIDVKDTHTQFDQDSATLQSGELWTRLRLSSQNRDAFVSIPLARIIEVRTDKQIILDKSFIPTCLNAGASNQLISYVREIEGMLHHRGNAIAQRLGSPGAGGAAEIVDFLYLQIINRYEPLFSHFNSLTQLHPERLFSNLILMLGELSTITQTNHRPVRLPVYVHENLAQSFEPVMALLRSALSWEPSYRAIPIPLEEHPHQIRTAIIADRQLLNTADFILAANADIPTEKLRSNFPRQTTIATVEKLRDLVMSQVPGIKLNALAVAPRQIPFHKGMTYFELDRNHSLWKELEKSGTIAMHFSGDYPGLELEFWAIRG
ncbi:MAG: type VI secretion system baseplate subunit TssK [Methylococcales bacterium]|nr:type VI secretion system baseplate subunit TssK [Methylococcales bacterium]